MSIITILHISDVHFGCPDPRGEQPRITNALTTAVHDHVAKSGYRAPDVCVFSGDLTHSGSVEQFTNGEAWLRTLLEPFTTCRLFIVPGNHEVQRPDNTETRLAANKFFGGAIVDAAAYDRFRADIIEQPLLHGFYTWHKEAIVRSRAPIVSDWEHSTLACHHKMDIDGVPLHLIGLNTALLSCADNDKGKLAADTKSLNECLLGALYDIELIVVISHHPIGAGKQTNDRWLVKWNDEELQTILLQSTGPHLYLHGHLHEASGTTMSLSTGQHLAFFGAGAAYDSQYPKMFAFYDVNLATGQIQPWTYAYRLRGVWTLENEDSQSIRAVLPHPLRGAGLPDMLATFVAPATRELPDEYNTYYGMYYLYNWAVCGGPIISEKN